MELNHLRVFFEVAKAGRFMEAAKRLNVSQSALSRSVALLEESEGVQLFERSKRGVTLTPVGQEVFLRCQELFRTFGEIEGICRGKRETCEGPLRFAAVEHVVSDLLVQPLQAFREKYPLVVPNIFTGSPDEIAQALLTTEYEFGLMFAKVALPQIEYHALRPEKMALVCKPEIWKKNKSSTTHKSLKNVLENAGYISSLGAQLNPRSIRVMRELFGEIPPVRLEINSQEAQKRCCMAGAGVAYLSRFMVQREIEKGRLFEIPLGDLHEFNLWLATKKGRQLSLAARTFIEKLRP